MACLHQHNAENIDMALLPANALIVLTEKKKAQPKLTIMF